MSQRVFAAVDLGASGGRVVAGLIDTNPGEPNRIELVSVHRFSNGVVERGGHLRWDIGRLFDEVISGLRLLGAAFPHVESIGIDTWGVDYALLDREGTLIADPISYRDGRGRDRVAAVHTAVSAEELFAINGLQHLPINTIFQLAHERTQPHWPDVEHVVMLPDLVAYWLTGRLATEETNASTTGLVDARDRTWSQRLLDAIDVPLGVFGDFARPGSIRGPLIDSARHATGLGANVVVTTVGSHDTASAVAAVPMDRHRSAYVSCGTWSLVGVELDSPVLNAEARAANFTNELGVDHRTRFLRNVGGLWLLQECVREWEGPNVDVDLSTLLAAAARLPMGGPLIDPDDEQFIEPGEMSDRIHRAVGRTLTPIETTRCILESLAAAYATVVESASALSDLDIDAVHLVGGGSNNSLLCRLTAQATARRVIAGPADATALGNILVQARAHGALLGTVDELRAAVPRHARLRVYEPS